MNAWTVATKISNISIPTTPRNGNGESIVLKKPFRNMTAAPVVKTKSTMCPANMFAHVREQTNRQCEMLGEKADDLDGEDQREQEHRNAGRREAIQKTCHAFLLQGGDQHHEKDDYGQGARHVNVRRRREPVMDQREDSHDVAEEDEEEQGGDQGKIRQPLRPHGVDDEFLPYPAEDHFHRALEPARNERPFSCARQYHET